MSLRNYFPISLAVFIGVVVAAIYFSAPVLPFALVLLVGETLFGFQLEDHQVPRFLAALFKTPASPPDFRTTNMEKVVPAWMSYAFNIGIAPNSFGR